MTDKQEITAADEGQLLAIDGHPHTLAPDAAERVRRRGGYFVGVAGWSGVAFWLAGKISSFVTSGIGWGAILAIAWIAVDESVRSSVRGFLGEGQSIVVSEDGSKKFPLLRTDDYHNLPISWRQLLAEVETNQSNYPTRFVSLIKELTLNDISRLDNIAPYVVGSSIIQADDFEMGYNIPNVNDEDFERLKTLGITVDGHLGMYKEIKPKDGRPGQSVFRGVTLGLLVQSPNPTKEFKVHVISLTEEGEQIINLLKKPTSLKGLCTIALRLGRGS